MDLYEKGIVNDRDTDGIAMEWKNHEAVYAMIEKIAMREGCGELFTEGIVKAADKIGKGADRYALHVKGLELPLLSHYYIDNALGAAISERGDSFRITSATVMLTLNTLPSVLPQKAIEGLIRKNFLPHSWDTMRDRHEYKGKGSLLAYHAREVAHIPDLLGICKFLVGWVPFFCYFKSDTMAKCLSLATGKDFDNEKLNSYCERMTDLIRAFNAREGITSKDDTVPDILFEEPSLVTGKPLDREKFNGMLGEVYSARGWNKNGMPTRERLEELGMKDVADDLDNRGLMLKKGR
jgi:aldehyde:ferredoxin oxidoreductase